MEDWMMYCRGSSEDSLNNQVLSCKEYCKKRWIKLILVFKEKTSWRRKVILNEAISYAINNNIQYFVAIDSYRITREYCSYCYLKKRLFDKGIKLISIR